MKNVLFVVATLLLSHLSFNQSVTYDSHDEIISNPERGFYHHTEVHSGNYSLLDLETLQEFRENESITQILRVFYLENFRETPISDEYLNNIRKDFNTIRKAGIKCILRFAYTTKSSAPYNDATPDIVQTHISQLKPILQNNADVIGVMQAGFIGAWGEWYYTDHFANSPGNIDEQDWKNRKDVVYSLLDALTPDRMLQIRTPGYKMIIFDSEDPISKDAAYDNSYNSRMGHHNDCFVASSSDYGTYINPDIEKPYLNKETTYTAMGGETCALASPYSDCENSLSELERFHWSYLNIDYNSQVLNEWDNQGCFDEVTLKLGYRYELLNGTFTSSVQPKGTFSFDLNLQNNGYSNPYNPRDIEIILRNQSNGDLYLIKPNTEIRLWPLGEEINLKFTAGIPSDIITGNYDLLLNLPDPYPTIHDNPAYSIQMANSDVWESNTGYNNLNHTVSITNSAEEPLYSGDMNFQPITSTSETLEIDGSDHIFGSSSINNLMVYWGRQSNSLQRIIERSTDNSNYEIIASIPADQDYFIDTDIIQSTGYSYRYYLSNGNETTSTSPSITLSTNDISNTEIAVDGNKEDWTTSPILSSSTTSGLTYSTRMYFDATKMNVLLEGPITKYKIYLDTDNDSNTGYSNDEHPANGADYLLANGELLQYNSEWTNINSPTTSTQGDIMEISVAFSDMENLSNQTTIKAYAELNDGTVLLVNQNGDAFQVHRNLPPDIPQSLTISNSSQYPDSRLLIEWEACDNCNGYLLERSTDEQTFSQVGTFNPQTTSTRDDNLLKRTTYYYRIASYNQLGQSDFSEVASKSTSILLGVQKSIEIYPNPTKELIYLPKAYESISILTLSGQEVQTKTNTDIVDLSNLSQGIYILRLQEKTATQTLKVIKQ